MKLPKHIKIGAHKVKVLYPYIYKERFDRYGHYDHSAEEIAIQEIDAGGSKRKNKSILISLIHETLHGIDTTTGYCLFDDNETALVGIAEGLAQVLLENPKLVKLFLKRKL